MQGEDDREGHAGAIDDEAGEEDDDAPAVGAANAHFAVVARIFKRGEGILIENGDGRRLKSGIKGDDRNEGGKREREGEDEQRGNHANDAEYEDEFTAAEEVGKEGDGDGTDERNKGAHTVERTDLGARKADAFVVKADIRDEGGDGTPVEEVGKPEAGQAAFWAGKIVFDAVDEGHGCDYT